MFGFENASATGFQQSDYLMRAHSGFSTMSSGYGLGEPEPLSQMQRRSSAAFAEPKALALTATSPDDTMAGAYNFGTLINSAMSDGTKVTRTYNTGFAPRDLIDYQKFTLDNIGSVEVTLANIPEDKFVYWRVIRDANRNGQMDPGEMLQDFSGNGTTSLDGLGADTYFIEINNREAWTGSYQVSVTAKAGIPWADMTGNDSFSAVGGSIQDQINGSKTFRGNVNSSSDPSDYYAFRVSHDIDFNAFLFPTQSDVNLYLYHDRNNNLTFDAGELIGFSANKGTTIDLIDKDRLQPGNYFLQVQKPINSPGATDYTVRIEGAPISSFKSTTANPTALTTAAVTLSDDTMVGAYDFGELITPYTPKGVDAFLS